MIKTVLIFLMCLFEAIFKLVYSIFVGKIISRKQFNKCFHYIAGTSYYSTVFHWYFSKYK